MPQYWRVAFDHGPINRVTAGTVAELSLLVDAIERDEDLNVVVFTSANSDFFLAHDDTEGDPAKTVSMPPGELVTLATAPPERWHEALGEDVHSRAAP